MDPSQLIQAIQDRAWYSVAALGIVLLIALGRKLAPVIWDKIPPRLKWAPAVLLAGGSAFVAAWQTGATWQQALSVAVFAAITGGTSAIGFLETGKRLKAKPEAPKDEPVKQG